jgi:hypothetical protein
MEENRQGGTTWTGPKGKIFFYNKNVCSDVSF